MRIFNERVKFEGFIGVLVYPNDVISNYEQLKQLGVCDDYDQWLDNKIGLQTSTSLYEYLASCLKRDELPSEIRHDKNLIVSNGRLQLMKLIDGNSTVFFQYINIGTGTTAPVTTDTDLQTPTTPRKQVSDRFESGNSGKWRVLFGSAENNNAAITEAGLFDSLTGGNMLNRQTFTAVDHSVSANNTITILVTLSQS